jgi:hypothetical protein
VIAATLLFAATLPIHGVFVELEHRDRIAESKANAIVIANIIGYDTGGCPRYDKFSQAAELIQSASLDAAIYVGLVYGRDFRSDVATEEELDRARREDVIVAKEFLAYLKERKINRKLAGWYLAREIHNFDDSAQQERIHQYLERVSRDLPKLGAILIAPFFVTGCSGSGTLNAKATGTMFADLIKGTKITHLLLQDGFSARFDHACSWPDWKKYALTAEDYEREVSKAVRKLKVKFWVDMEVFGAEATADRIAAQYAILPDTARVIAYKYDDCRKQGMNADVCPK